MKDIFIFEHKKYISAKRASDLVSYTRDYVGQLCRAGKVVSKMVGRVWFVEEGSIIKHKELNVVKGSESVSVNNFSVPEIPVLPSVSQTPSPLLTQTVVTEAVMSDEPKVFIEPKIVSQVISVSQNSVALSRLDLNSYVASFVVLFVLLMNIFYFDDSIFMKVKSVASVFDSPIVRSIDDYLGTVLSYISKTSEKLAFNKNNSIENAQESISPEPQKPVEDFNAIAVLPSTGSAQSDEIMKQRIKDNFSDEVKVVPDETGTSGVIKPVFKKITSDDYIYVLVPTIK